MPSLFDLIEEETSVSGASAVPAGRGSVTGPPATSGPPVMARPPAKTARSLFDMIDEEEPTAPPIGREEDPVGLPSDPGVPVQMGFVKRTFGPQVEAGQEAFGRGMDLTEAGFKSLMMVPGIKPVLSLPGAVTEFLSGALDIDLPPEKLGLALPEPEQILPELPESTPKVLRPFFEAVRTFADPVVGGAAAVVGPFVAVTGAMSEALVEKPVRDETVRLLKRFRDDPESVPPATIAPVALWLLKQSGFTLEDKDIEDVGQFSGMISGVLTGLGVGGALLKSGNSFVRGLGDIVGGQREFKPTVKIGPGEAPMIPKEGAIIGLIKKYFTPLHMRNVALDQLKSELHGNRTLGQMRAQRIFQDLEASSKVLAKETGIPIEDIRVSMGNALKGMKAAQLDPRLEKAIRPIREQINAFQRKAAEVGLIGEDIVERTVDEYITRAYMVKIAPDSWVPPPGVLERARLFLSENMRVPVERASPLRAPKSVEIERVRREATSTFNKMIRERRMDPTMAQRVVRDMRRRVVGTAQENVSTIRGFLGTEKNPTPFARMIARRIVDLHPEITIQQASGAMRSILRQAGADDIFRIGAAGPVDVERVSSEIRKAIAKNVIKETGAPPEVIESAMGIIRETREAFDEMSDSLKAFRKERMTKAEEAQLRSTFNSRLDKITGKGPVSFRKPTSAEVEGAIEEILGGSDEFTFRAAQGGRSVRINMGPFTKRKDIPKEIRDLMGEIHEGSTAAALTIQNLSRAIASKKFLDAFAKGSEVIEFGGTRQIVPWVTPTRVPGYTQVNGKAWGPLDGKFVLNKHMDDLADFASEMSTEGTLGKIQRMMMNFFKVSKTILSPSTHMRNVLGNTMFADLAGIPVWDPRNAKYYARASSELLASGRGITAKGLRAARPGIELTEEGITPLVREAIENGAIHTEMFGSEVFRDVLQTFEKQSPQKAMLEMSKQPIKALGRIYNAEDQVFKFATYIKMREAGMTGADNGLFVRQHYPNYRDVSRVVSSARTSIMGAPFVTFYSEALRISAVAAKEHPVKLGKWLMALPAMSAGAAAAIGLTLDQVEKIKKTLPSYKQQPGEVLWFFKDDQGNVQTFDMTYVHPLGSLFAARRQGLDIPIVGEFVLNNPIFNTAMEYLSDTNPITKGPSRQPGQTEGQWLADMFVRNFAPSLTPLIPGVTEGGTSAREISKAVRRARGEHAPGRFGQSPSLIRTLVNELGPLRVTPVDANLIAAGLMEKRGKLNELARGIRRVPIAISKGRISVEEGQKRVQRIMREIREIIGVKTRLQTRKPKEPTGAAPAKPSPRIGGEVTR